VAVTVVDFNKATSTSFLLKMLNKNQRHVPAMRVSKMNPSTHCILEDKPCSTSKKYRLRYITSVILPAVAESQAVSGSSQVSLHAATPSATGCK
jgi:hypothetical protein